MLKILNNQKEKKIKNNKNDLVIKINDFKIYNQP